MQKDEYKKEIMSSSIKKKIGKTSSTSTISIMTQILKRNVGGETSDRKREDKTKLECVSVACKGSKKKKKKKKKTS